MEFETVGYYGLYAGAGMLTHGAVLAFIGSRPLSSSQSPLFLLHIQDSSF